MNEVFIFIDILEFMMNGMFKKNVSISFLFKKILNFRVLLLNSYKL